MSTSIQSDDHLVDESTILDWIADSADSEYLRRIEQILPVAWERVNGVG